MSREWIAKGLLAVVFLLAAILKVQAEAGDDGRRGSQYQPRYWRLPPLRPRPGCDISVIQSRMSARVILCIGLRPKKAAMLVASVW